MNDWKSITRDEFFVFLAINFLMGNVKMPSLKHYWRTKDGLYFHPIFRKNISRDRFEDILRALQFYDVREPADAKGKKITQVWWIASWRISKKTYDPPKQLSLDEALIGFKERLTYKQYLPKKRRRFGLKLFEVCSHNGYVLNIILYTGKGTTVTNKEGSAYNIVLNLLKNSYLNKGHTIYLDNWYTSISIAECLFKKGTQIVGTLRANRREIPKEITNAKLRIGESYFMRRKHLLIQKMET